MTKHFGYNIFSVDSDRVKYMGLKLIIFNIEEFYISMVQTLFLNVCNLLNNSCFLFQNYNVRNLVFLANIQMKFTTAVQIFTTQTVLTR